uniref:Microtubule associated tumor suppressor candidate 2 n=1 Tax=Rhipicephalus appendiculatus TaxID=34631 RepID=A0A131YK54_RHIAP
MSSWRKKMRVKWNRNLDGGPSASNAIGGEDPPQLGLFERQGSLRKPSAPDKEEPFKRSWSFRIGGSGSKTKDASPGGNDKNAFLRMFRFGKDKKKGGHQEPGRRRMSDAAVTEAAARKEELSQWSSVPLDVSESPEAKRRQEAALVMRAHTLPRSLEAAPGGSECPDDAGGDVNAIWGLIYCDPRAEVNGDLIRPPRAKSPRNRESRSGKVFSDAVLPHFLSPGLDLSAGDAEQDEKRALKKLLLNGTCPAAEVLSENADGGHSVVNGAVVSGESEAVSADCGPPSADSVQADSGVASGAESCSEGKFVVANSDTERDEVPNAASEPCEHEIPLSEQDGEPASNVTFVVEVNECYQDDCDQTEQAPCIENNRENTQPPANTEDRSQVFTDSHDRASEICPPESNVDANEQVANEDAEATDFERSCQRQRHDSASTGSNCEECPAQDEFEFVAAEPERPEQQRRMSRETVSPISDVSDDFPADEKASFIFLKPDRAGESFLSPLSTPDDDLDGGPFGHQPLVAGDDCGTPGERYGNGVCSESDLESEDLNEPEEREVIIVDHLPSQESQDAPDVCVIGSDMIQSVNYETFVLENEVTLGTSGASSAQEAAQSGGTRASTARADSPPPANADGSAPRDAVEEEVPGENKLEASEGSFQDKLQYFNAISASPPKAASESKRPRTSRIPTASRLPRPSTAARPAKKESGIPVLTAAPVPAKRSRFGAKVGHIPQPSRNNACSPQQRQQVTPSLTRVTAAVAPNRDCSVAPKVPLFSGISKNVKHARHAAAESNIAVAEEASKAQEAPGQLKRSGTFVLEESEQQPTDAVRSASLPRAAAEKDVVARETSSASPRPKQHQQTTSGKDNVRVDSVQKRPAASPVAPVVVRDAAMKVASPCVSAASAPPSVQVPVVDSTDRALPSSDGDNDEDAACPCCNVKKGTAGATTRVNSQGPGTGPPSKIGEARIQAQTKAEFTKEIQRLGALCESRTKELTMLKLQLRHASAGFASFAVVVQHLNAQVLQNNSFRIPKLSEELRKSQEEIDKARIAIEEYKNKIEELKQSHEKEIIALREELEASHKKRTEELEAAHQNELTGYLEAHARKLEEMKTFYTDVVDSSRKSSDETLDAMKQRHREKIDAINEEYSLQLDSINEDHQARYKELEQRYEALQQQYKQLQQQAREFQESVLSDTDAKIQWLSKKNADLQKEVESLNVVLEMRANQIQNLQHAKIELERKEEELDRCKVKMQKMEARIEDLQELLNEKAKVQSQLSVENAKLRETSEKQNRQLSRLDMHNEELKYKLRESVSSPMRDGGNKARARSTAHKRYSVADPTAMSQSWHAADHQSSPRASNGGGRLLSGAHGLHRINQTSHSLPRGSSEGFQPRMRRSMSETSPPQDACVQQLFASFAADVSGDGSADESFSTFENSPCSQDDLLRLTWVKEDGDILQQDSETPNTPRVDSS